MNKRIEAIRELKEKNISYDKQSTTEELQNLVIENNKINIEPKENSINLQEVVKYDNIELKPKIVTNPQDMKQYSFYEKKELPNRVEIYKNNGEYVRTYSPQLHGRDYQKLADEFLRGRILRLTGQILGDY